MLYGLLCGELHRLLASGMHEALYGVLLCRCYEIAGALTVLRGTFSQAEYCWCILSDRM